MASDPMKKARPIRVEVKPKLLRWARQRSGIDPDILARRFPKLAEWEREVSRPTLRQLEEFAKATNAPIGYLFLAEPPVERVPIPDFRTAASRQIRHASPNTLDTIYICQQRQEWYRNFLRSSHEKPLGFVGSATLEDDIESTASRIRSSIGFDVEQRRRLSTWTEALRLFLEQSDALGVLVMVSGVVGSNNYRKLDIDEFRGFAISDEFAPLVFLNGNDTKSGQMFTLAHELAHIWLGQSALSSVELVDDYPVTQSTPEAIQRTENWCNHVAAEILVPLSAFRYEYRKNEKLRDALDRLARLFKVSTLVILRRIYDVGGLSRADYWKAHNEELGRLRSRSRTSGGDFYLTLGARVGKRFARALVVSTLEGQTLYRDAFRLLGFSKLSTFQEFARSLEVA